MSIHILAVAPGAARPDSGFAVRVLSLLQALEQHACTVDYFSVQLDSPSPGYDSHTSRFSDAISPTAIVVRDPRWRIPHLSLIPESVITYNHRQTRDALRAAANTNGPFDVAVAFSTFVMPSVLAAFAGPVVLDATSVDSLIFKRLVAKARGLSRLRARAVWLKWSAFEARMIRSAAFTTVVSAEDRSAAMRLVPSYRRWALVENGVDVDFYSYRPAPPTSKRLIFLGALKHPTNRDALRWFVERVYPLVKAFQPNVEMIVTGHKPGIDPSPFDGDPSIRFSGFVDDLRPTLEECAVSIVPTQVAAGSRIKILESLAAGVAVVSTTAGAEGLRVTSGTDICIADDPVEFARHISRLLANPRDRDAQTQRGRQLVTATYSWAHQGRQLRRVLEDVMRVGGGGMPG